MSISISGSTGISGVDGSASTPAIQGSDTNTGISFGTDTVNINTGGTTRATVDSSGRFGVGAASPGERLHVYDSSVATTRAIVGANGTGAATPLALALEYDTTGNTLATVRNIYNNASAELRLGGYGFITFTSGSSQTERLRITSNGNTLIGTNTARSGFFNGAGGTDARLLVETTSTINAICSVYSAANDGGSYLVLAKQRSGSIGGFTAPNSGDEIGGITFQGADGTDFVEAARIQAFADGTPGANDMPGRLSFFTAAPAAIQGAGGKERMRIGNLGTTQIESRPNNVTLQLRYVGSPDTGNDIQQVYRDASISANSGVLCCRIRSDGNLQNTNGSYTQISDAKLKENIVDANSQWDDIKGIRIRNWNFKEETGNLTHKQIGPIAQELEEVCPNLVFDTPDRDGEGNDLGTVTKGVNQSVLYMKAVKALQEAMERIESLEARLTTLEGGAL